MKMKEKSNEELLKEFKARHKDDDYVEITKAEFDSVMQENDFLMSSLIKRMEMLGVLLDEKDIGFIPGFSEDLINQFNKA